MNCLKTVPGQTVARQAAGDAVPRGGKSAEHGQRKSLRSREANCPRMHSLGSLAGRTQEESPGSFCQRLGLLRSTQGGEVMSAEEKGKFEGIGKFDTSRC